MARILVGVAERISSLTLPEWVGLKSTLHAADRDMFNCHVCLGQFQGRGDREMMLQRDRERKGCWGGTVARHQIPFGPGRAVVFSGCIGNYTRDFWGHWVELHAAFQRGVLPFPGTIQEQPNKAMEIFRTIDQHRNFVMAERAEDEKRRASMIRGQRGR